MINLTHLEKQHQNIKEVIKVIVDMTEKPDYENNLMEITLHINKLAGLLNVTKNKVLADIGCFIPATKAIVNKIKNRMEKEDNNLYNLISQKGI